MSSYIYICEISNSGREKERAFNKYFFFILPREVSSSREFPSETVDSDTRISIDDGRPF